MNNWYKEEAWRQALLKEMTEELGYPKELLVIERALSELPHLASYPQKLPFRRIDILCYSLSKDGQLKPLLLVECKRAKVTSLHMKQALGYNYYIQAPFVMLSSPINTLYSFKEETSMPSYQSLLLRCY